MMTAVNRRLRRLAPQLAALFIILAAIALKFTSFSGAKPEAVIASQLPTEAAEASF